MSVVDLPCEYEEWWDYQKVFILLSHLRSVLELNLLISCHTRTGGGEEASDSPTSRCLGALKGLLTFLTEYYTPEEQKRFVSHTLPFVARAACLLEERVPLSGIPRLQKQESKDACTQCMWCKSVAVYCWNVRPLLHLTSSWEANTKSMEQV